jgi:hemerythrin superfamily protein
MRSLADQTVAELGGRGSILVRQRRDHATLGSMLDQLPGTTGAEQEELLHSIYRLVFSHAFAEEAVLWPAARRSLADGEELTARIEREHQEITELVANLERSADGDPRRPALIERTVEMLRRDVRDEEDLLLPRLQDAVDGRTLRRLGWTWALVRRTAPTRSHPIVSRRPPGQTLSALPLSVTDRLRDGLDHAARRSPTRWLAGALSLISQCLGAIAGRIEELPPLRRGERLDTRVPPESR